MDIKTTRNGEKKEVDRVYVFIGETKYTLSESVDGKLNINKTQFDGEEAIVIHPRYTNVIEVS